MRRVDFAPDARAELEAAVAWYEADRPGRGLALAAAVERTARMAAAMPNSGALFPGIPEHFAVRRRLVRRFPFVLAYRALDDAIRIEAVAPTRRWPGYWLRRLESE